jgi:hypothetical protein
MPLLTEQFIKDKIELLSDPYYKTLRSDDLKRSNLYGGQVKSVVQDAIMEEFKKPETVTELNNRLIPINLSQKILNKLAQVYKTKVVRKAKDRHEGDQENIEFLEESMRIDTIMKESNVHFKNYKRDLLEPYVNEKGEIKLRTLDRHTYEVFSHSLLSPHIPDTVIKILQWDDSDPKNSLLAFWTDEQFLIVNGKGEIAQQTMLELNNLDGVNPYGVLPFVYINQSTQDVIPIADDDLLRMSVAIPLLLSDLAFSIKYQAWSVIYTVGLDGDLPMNPNSVINLERDEEGNSPEINSIKPEIDIPNVLKYIESLIAMLLTTKNLSVSSVSGKLEANNAASGISKMLDNAETMEDRKDQQQYFVQAEKELWKKLAFNLIPVWIKQGILNNDNKMKFSKDFDIEILFVEPKPIVSEKEMIETASLKIDKSLSSRRREIQNLNPNMSADEVDMLLEEIDEEKSENMLRLQEEMTDGEDESEDEDGEE